MLVLWVLTNVIISYCISLFFCGFLSASLSALDTIWFYYSKLPQQKIKICLYISLSLSLSLLSLSLSVLHLYLWFYFIFQIHSPMSPEKEQKYIDVDGKFDIDFPGGIITTLILLVIQKSLFLCRCLWRS